MAEEEKTMNGNTVHHGSEDNPREQEKPTKATAKEIAHEDEGMIPLEPYPTANPTPISKVGRQNEQTGGTIVKNGGIKLYIVNTIITIILVYAMTSMGFSGAVPVTKYNENQAGMIKQVNDASDASNKAITNLNAAVQNIPTTLTNQINAAMQAYNSQLSQFASKSDITNLSQSLSSLSGTTQTNLANSLNSMTGQLNAQVATLSANLTIISAQNHDLKSQLASAQSDIATLKQQIVALTPTTTPPSNTPSSTATSTFGSATASIVTNNYVWGGGGFSSNNPTTAYALTPSGNTTVGAMGGSTMSNTFNLIIDNKAGRAITNIQMAMNFMFTDSQGLKQYDLPQGTTVSLGGWGGISWTAQNAGAQNQLVFTVGSGTTYWSGVWNLSQNPGSQTYYVTMTVTFPTGAGFVKNDAPVASSMTGSGVSTVPSQYIVYPLIKLIGYS